MNTVEHWLEQKRRRQRLLAILLAPAALLGGLLIMFFTFWLFYALIFAMGMGVSAAINLVTTDEFIVPHSWRLALAGAWLLLVCVSYVHRPMSNMEPIPATNYVSWSPTFHGGGTVAGLVMMAAYPGATAHLLRDLFQTGPRLIHGAIALWQLQTALNAIQPGLCAIYLERLSRAAGALTWDELESIHEPGYASPVIAQLRNLEGVVLLEKGVSLTSELRGELRPMLSAGVSSSVELL